MNYLLDTHVLLWWGAGDRRLRPPVRRRIAEGEIVLVSAASAWEAAIKVGLGRLELEVPFEELVDESGFGELPVTMRHASGVSALPNHHSDPFDRLLIAQALVEGLTLVTHDRAFEPYGAACLWV